MSFKKIRGTIPFFEGTEDPNSSALPSIEQFSVEFNPDNINQFFLLFIVLNSATLVLERKFFNPITGDYLKSDSEGTPVDFVEKINIDINNNTNFSKFFTKHKQYKSKFKLKASNKNGAVEKELELIDVATDTLQTFADSLFSDFSVVRTDNSYDEVDVKITINQIEGFSLSNLSALELLYKRQDFESYLSLKLNKSNPVLNKNESGIVISYTFSYKKLKILRPSIGGFFNFFSRITIADFEPQDSATKIVYFPDLNPGDPKRPQSDNDFPDAVIYDQTASLSYEITAKFSEVFLLGKNGSYTRNNGEEIKSEDVSVHQFLDTEEIPKISLTNTTLLINDINFNRKFIFEFNNDRNNNETKGYLYPAAVTDILPYIIVNQINNVNDSLILFWKINDDFYNYSFGLGEISVTTSEFIVKLQYKNSSGVYIDLTNPIKLEQNKHYQTETNKFILKISKQDVLNQTLFEAISKEQDDNETDNLKIVVVSHSVLCFTKGVGGKSYTFDKLLMPHKWKYLVYDKYIPRDSDVRDFNDQKITLNLENTRLRGIRLPDKGFTQFDNVSKIQSAGRDTQDIYISTFDNQIFFKLSCAVSSFYLDPIIQGTVNTITLPSIPDDVFIIPPKVVIPPPNLKTIENGGKQAEAVVYLNEYGKIAGVQMAEIGEGYSLYSSYLTKRQQTFSDFNPVVKSSYTVVGSNLNLNKQFLIPQNASFDSNNLKASLVGGVRLASVYQDKLLTEQNVSNPFSEPQKIELEKYLTTSIPEPVEIENNSVEPYNENSDTINSNSEPILDDLWGEISKLYTEKFNNPLNEVNVYSENNEVGSTETGESDFSADIPSSENSLTPISLNPEVPQTNTQNQPAELFSLNGLIVVPDGSPAYSVSDPKVAPPWLTLMPLTERSDGMWSFGPLPNMTPRAEMFNRLVMGINSLDEVRVIAPFVWIVDQVNSFSSWAVPIPEGQNIFKTIDFQRGGSVLEASDATPVQTYQPINGGVVVGASRSVTKGYLTREQLDRTGLTFGEYAISSENSQTVTFKPVIHPLMIGAIPDWIVSGLRRRFLGLVTENTASCSSIKPGEIYCQSPGSETSTPYPLNLSLPYTKNDIQTRFEFFDSGGSLNASANGTARFLGFPYGRRSDGSINYCSAGCGDGYSKSINFAYTNMYPATYKL